VVILRTSWPWNKPEGLLDLAFLVDHVLADDGIVLLDFHLGGRVLLVLVGSASDDDTAGR
jgi:hypothetical protein